MAPFRQPRPDTAYPPSPASARDQHQLFSSADHDLIDPSSLSLGYDPEQSLLGQSIPLFVTPSQSTTTAAEQIDEFGLSPFQVLSSPSSLPNNSFDQSKLSPQSVSGLAHRNGPKPPKAEPWTSVAVTGQAMTGPSYPQELTVKTSHSNHPHPDSGYESSLLSASMMSQNRPAPKRQRSFADGAMMEEMQHVLPDQSLPSSMAMTPLPRAKARSSSTSTGKPDSADGFYCTTCKTPFSTSSEYQKHMARHEKKYKCRHVDCNRHAGFATTNDLERHRKGVHGEIGLEDPVWKCFVEGCKSAGKIWSRQDNFRAHIDRMHKDVDPTEYVRISDRWFNDEEKPRRLQELTSNSTDLAQNQDVGIGRFHQYSGARTEQNYPSSHIDPSDGARSVAGEFPDTRGQPSWDMGQSSSVSQNYANMYSPTAFTGMMHYASVGDSMRGFSNPTALSYSSMTQSGLQNDPPLPLAHRDNDFGEHFRNNNMDPGYWNVIRPLKTRTLPDHERMNNTLFPDWQTNYETTSPIMDIPPTNPQIELLFMGGENTNPPTQFPEGDMLGAETPLSNEQGTNEPSPSAEQITEKNNQEFRHEISQLLDKCPDPRLAQMLKESFTKTLREHSSSTSVNVGTTLSPVTADQSNDQLGRFPCRRAGCRKTFTMKNRLTKHEKRHDRIFFCTFDRCYKRFGTKTDLSRHEYRVHKQIRAWRCWSNSHSRDKNKKCSMLLYDEQEFEEHRKDKHSKTKMNIVDFKIEPAFSGAFWCGFCNAVVENPVAVDIDGLKRIQHRYLHIEAHMNELYAQRPEHDAMESWTELDGNGKTKAEIRDSGKTTGDFAQEDDDSEEDDDDSGPSPRNTIGNPGGLRARASTGTSATSRMKRHGQFLEVPGIGGPSHKRAGEFPIPNLPASQMYKYSKIQAPRSVSGGSHFQRHASISGGSGIGGSSGGPAQHQPSLTSDTGNGQSVVAYIKCCKCNAKPRVNDLLRTCNNHNCMEPNCEKCIYYGKDQRPLRMTSDGMFQSMG